AYPFGNDTPDATPAAALQVELFLDVLRQRKRRLDHLAVEVDNVESAVRTDGEIDGSEPVIGGGEEFTVAIGPLGGDNRAGRREDVAVDEIICRIADKSVAAVRRWKRVRRVDDWAASRSDVAAGDQFGGWKSFRVRTTFAASRPLHAPGLERTDAVHFASSPMVGDVERDSTHWQERVAAKVGVGQEDLPQVLAVGGGGPVVPIMGRGA